MGEHKGHSPNEDNRKLLKLKFRQFTKSDVPLHETPKKKEAAPEKKKTAIKFEKAAPSPSRKSAATRTTKDAASNRPKEKSPAKSVRSARHKKSPAEEKSARRGRAHMRSASIRRAHAKRLQDEQAAKERMARERTEQERRRRGRSRRLYRASDDDEDSEYGWEMVAPSEEEERETREWFVNAARVIREEDEEERDDEQSEEWKDLMRQILACTNPRQEEEETLELLTEYDALEGDYGEAPPRGGSGSGDRADRAEAPKPAAASREKADEAHPQARRLLHIVKESNMLEESLYAEQNKVLRDFFERGMTDPTPKILSLLEKSMNYIIDTALYKTEQLAEPIDNELRKFVLDRDVAKVHLLDTMLACPEYLPLNWGGKLVIIEPKKNREQENPITSPSLSPISITWSTLFRGIKDALVGSPRPDPPKKTEDKTKWEL